MSKSASCNKCGKEGLSWNQSKKGYWYLSDPATISTKTYGSNLTIPFAHKCASVPEVEERNESYWFDHADGRFI